ncbi:HDIG domain-containing protein [Sphingobacterium sp. E70]|uniref:HDIG domain-containing metalloprotein n=1 Tax=Sphingobacterium sp. E70 TaxID=2853439 RepID=UPI00211CA63A|nr:HDIG domain-containing metalloprotein [Sphingobacterium sp. E70]ULT24476.1 HDIG domain-containing protein [Sphingobacterium sp. E70]
MVRAGALYHDIGKLTNPQFFIENQKTEKNPHDELSPEQSAQIIISHVIKGVDVAKKHQLPEVILDFIRTHHGTTRVDYFTIYLLKIIQTNSWTNLYLPTPAPSLSLKKRQY